METTMEIGPAHICGEGGLTVMVAGCLLYPGEKYTFLEKGWALYLSADSLQDDWLLKYAESRPAEEDWNSFISGPEFFFTTHPILVALSLRAWWHNNSRPLPLGAPVPVPTFEEACEEVRQREILNDFNSHHAGEVPGLRRWKPLP